MARVRKPKPTLDGLFFATPAQKVLRLLLSESTTVFPMRALSSKLKGVRGLGGADGISKLLKELHEIGLVDFVDNDRAVRLRDDVACTKIMKTMGALCDLESLRELLEPVSSKGVLFGSRACGRARSDSDYDLFLVTETPEEAEKIAASHPLGKVIELVAWTPERFEQIGADDPALERKLENGIVLWGGGW
jgi:predicted nucleotidyltransferase